MEDSNVEVHNPGKIKKMMIILSKGSLDSVYECFILANGARMEGIESEIFFTFFGMNAVVKSRMEYIRVATVGNPALKIPTLIGGLPGMEALATKKMLKEMDKLDIPEVEEFLEILSASGTKLWACKLAKDMFKVEDDDFIEELDGILTVGDFYGRAEGEGTHIIFI